MRASATSRTASANHHVSQAKADANKAGEASPFALLVETVAPAQAAKPSKKDARDSGDKPADDKPVVNPDDKTGAAQAATPPVAKAKPEKSDKDKTEAAAKPADGAADDGAILTADLQLLNPQAPPVPPAQMPVVPAPADGKPEDIQIGAAATAGAAAKPDPIDAAMSAAKSADKSTDKSATPAAAPVSAQSDDSQIEDPQVPEAAIAQFGIKAVTSSGDAAKSVKAAATSKSLGNDNGADSTNANSGKSDLARNEAAKSAAANVDIPGLGVPRSDIATAHAGKEDITKGNVTRGSSAKGRIAQIDVAKSDDTRNDASKAVSQSGQPPIKTAETVAPKVSQDANIVLGIDNAAPTLLPNRANTHAITQHVPVSPQAAPNLPALAVEIAAKSQSGAKQFDIRLDPPELGRVEVRLSIDATGKASAHLSADQPQTLSLLQKDAPILTRALREAGLDVSQDGLNFSLRQQGDGQNANTNSNGRRGTSRAFSLIATTGMDATATAYRGRTDGRLDIRV